MVQNYILKREILYDVLKCPKTVYIPTNDFEAWKRRENKPYLWIYNKLQIAQSQHLCCAPIGVKPLADNFPVIVKPIINLYGMGYHAYRFDNLDEYKRDVRKILSLPGMFWSPFFKGKHISVDVLLQNGKIKWYCAFQGHNKYSTMGAFDYWESLPKYKISLYIRKWIKKHLSCYTGCINLELIGKYIIEGHLRMGDLNQFDIFDGSNHTLMNYIIDLYSNNNSKPYLTYRIPKIYLVVLFLTFDEYARHKQLSTQNLNDICDRYDVTMVQRDPPPTKVTYPSSGIRMFCLTTDNLTKGLVAKSVIKKQLLYHHHNNNNNKVIIVAILIIIVNMLVLYFLI